MPERTNDKTIFSLVEVTRSIQKTLSDRYQSAFWVKAEMNKLNYYKHSGHCYPDLVEKQDGKVIAQMRSCLWRDDYLRIDNKFLAVLKEPLREGIKILFLAKISFDPAHGLSLLIMDIDPAYTLGDLEREKQETIRKLREEDLFDKNKALPLPLLPQRIAIISVETSKGFADFNKIIEGNPWRYRFFLFLFPSLLQGDNAVASIISQLKRIRKVKDHFDVVAIIRGGGGDVGLSCYNNYQLAKEIALFPIPVITGIGHATNETVSEMVSFYNAITPTKLAEYLLQKFHNFSVPVQEAEKRMANRAASLLREEKLLFQSTVKLFKSVTGNVLLADKNEVLNLSRAVDQYAGYFFRRQREQLTVLKQNVVRSAGVYCKEKRQDVKQFAVTAKKDIVSQINHRKMILSQLGDKLRFHGLLACKDRMSELKSMEKNVNNMSPQAVLKRGYSITLLNGKAVHTVSSVVAGDTVETVLSDGRIVSIVKSSDKSTHE